MKFNKDEPEPIVITDDGITKFCILPDGDLQIILRPLRKKALREKFPSAPTSWDNQFAHAIDYHLCNGFDYVNPEEIPGAMTDAPIIGRDVLRVCDLPPDHPEYDPHDPTVIDGDLWWFPNYMVEDPLETLLDEGKVTFARVLSEEEHEHTTR